MIDDQLNPDLLAFENDFEDEDISNELYSYNGDEDDEVMMDSYDDMDMF